MGNRPKTAAQNTEEWREKTEPETKKQQFRRSTRSQGKTQRLAAKTETFWRPATWPAAQKEQFWRPADGDGGALEAYDVAR